MADVAVEKETPVVVEKKVDEAEVPKVAEVETVTKTTETKENGTAAEEETKTTEENGTAEAEPEKEKADKETAEAEPAANGEETDSPSEAVKRKSIDAVATEETTTTEESVPEKKAKLDEDASDVEAKVAETEGVTA